MKKIIPIVLILIATVGVIHAQDLTDERTAEELAVMRKKLGRLQREMNSMMRDVIMNAGAGVPAPDISGSAFGGDVNVDILQTDKNVIVRADLPGMQKDKIDIILENNRMLKIAGSREITKSVNTPGVVKQERFSGRFEKVVELPCEVENSGVNAVYKDGVLEVSIPKRVQTKKEEKVKINVK